jgi:hypothetical protein
MTCSDLKSFNYTDPAQPRRAKKYVCQGMVSYRSHPAGQKNDIYAGVIKKVRYVNNLLFNIL